MLNAPPLGEVSPYKTTKTKLKTLHQMLLQSVLCCLLDGIGEVFTPLFQHMSCSYQDWRWVSLVDAVAQVS